MVSQLRKQAGNVAANGTTTSPANAINDDVILNAAYRLLLEIGVRRMTMADIARHAGVSRATLYRRWQNVREVVAALLTREWSALAERASARIDGDGRQRLVDVVVSIVRASREHPVLRKIIELDPDFLTPYLLKRRGANTVNQLALIEQGIRDGIADGSIPAGDRAGDGAADVDHAVEARARAVLLAGWAFALTGPVLTEDVGVLDRELRTMIDRYLS